MLNKWLFLVPVKGGRWHIIPQFAVYTTYILPSVGVICYHLLWEPEKPTIDWIHIHSYPSVSSLLGTQAVLDAAQIAGLNILRVMNEHTATALAYGIYRSNDFDPEKPMNVALLGGKSLQKIRSAKKNKHM